MTHSKAFSTESLAKMYSLSIIGNVKNAGKTVTLNYLVNKLDKYTLGVTSIGLDGEQNDVLTYTPKPLIHLPGNTVVATAAQTLKSFSCSYEVLKGTNIFSPLGEILYIRLRERGQVLLAGPKRRSDLKRVIMGFRDFNCTKVLVDGAIDRKVSASPFVTDGTIFVAGASYSRDFTRLIKDTIHQLNLLSLPKTDECLIKSAALSLEGAKVAIIRENEIELLPYKSAILVSHINEHMIKGKVNNIVIGGALLDSFGKQLVQLLKKRYKVRVVVEDGTKVFLSPEVFNDFTENGGSLEVMTPCKIVALAVNPVSIEGYEFSSDKLIQSFRSFTDIPVFDPLM